MATLRDHNRSGCWLPVNPERPDYLRAIRLEDLILNDHTGRWEVCPYCGAIVTEEEDD